MTTLELMQGMYKMISCQKPRKWLKTKLTEICQRGIRANWELSVVKNETFVIQNIWLQFKLENEYPLACTEIKRIDYKLVKIDKYPVQENSN